MEDDQPEKVYMVHDLAGADVDEMDVEGAQGLSAQVVPDLEDIELRLRPAGIMWGGSPRRAQGTLTGLLPISFDAQWPKYRANAYAGVHMKDKPFAGIPLPSNLPPTPKAECDNNLPFAPPPLTFLISP